MPIRAVLFDFNGILVDDEPLHLQLFQRVLAEEGVAMSATDYQERWLGLDDRGCLTAALRQAGREPEPSYLARLIARKAAYYQAEIRRAGFVFFPGGLELLREMSGAGCMIGVVSGALRDEIEPALSTAGVRDRVKTVVAADDVAESKPAPEGYLKGLEELNGRPPLPDRLIHPHEVVAIEDSPAGIAAARAVGLRTLGVGHTYPLAALELAEARVERLAGLDLAGLKRLFPD